MSWVRKTQNQNKKKNKAKNENDYRLRILLFIFKMKLFSDATPTSAIVRFMHFHLSLSGRCRPFRILSFSLVRFAFIDESTPKCFCHLPADERSPTINVQSLATSFSIRHCNKAKNWILFRFNCLFIQQKNDRRNSDSYSLDSIVNFIHFWQLPFSMFDVVGLRVSASTQQWKQTQILSIIVDFEWPQPEKNVSWISDKMKMTIFQ